MFKHPIPEFIPGELGLGEKTKLTVKHKSSTPVPPEEGDGTYPKSPTGGRDDEGLRRDLFFFGTLFALYGEQPFPRGNLDAGRMNRLWSLHCLVLAGEYLEGKDPERYFRLDARAASLAFADVQVFNNQ
jgi:hypothetical protein